MSEPIVRPAHLDDVARLLAEPSRLRMLWALGDGRAYTATELAGVAELTPSAASNHLARLVDAGVVEARSQGRHRYFALTREDVARAVESLGAVTLGSAPPAPVRRQPSARSATHGAAMDTSPANAASRCGIAAARCA